MTTLKIQIGNLSILKFFASQADIDCFTEHEEFELECIVGDCDVNEYEGNITPQCMLIDYEIHPIEKQVKEYNWEDIFQ